MNNNHKSKEATLKTLKKLSPAILIALIATALGFLSLYSSPIPMIQDFGKMLTIGMIISFIVTILFLIPALFISDYFFGRDQKDKIKPKPKNISKHRLENITKKITRQVLTFKWLILMIAILTASIGIYLDLGANVDTDVENFMPQENQELKDIHYLRDKIGSTDQVSILYGSEYLLTDEILIWIDNMTVSIHSQFQDEVIHTKSITSILNQINPNQPINAEQSTLMINQLPSNQKSTFINDNYTQGVIIVGIKHLEAKELKDFIQELEDYIFENKIANIDMTITGKSVVDVEMISALTTGRYTITLLGMLAVFIGLLIIYRNPIKAFIPLLPITFIIGWSGGLMYLLNIKYTPLTATLGALIIGIGTEFTILIMERFKEEQQKYPTLEEAIIYTVSKISKPILASGLTTIGGFSALIISDFIILRNFGIMTIINISLALISTLIVMPIILVLLGRFTYRKT